MKKFLKTDEWNVIEESFHADNLRAFESIFSLGNGRLGQRGNFEETYSSDTLQGSYLAGISFLDKTRVGWWKNGYPNYFTRIPNAPNWSGIIVRLIDEELDLALWDVDSFERRLDMKEGISYRDFQVTSPKGHKLKVHVEHITSMANQNLCIIKYSVTSVNYEGKISLVPYINGDVKHETSNFNEKMWNILRAETTSEYAYLWTQTRHEDSQVCSCMTYQLFKNSKEITGNPIKIEKEKMTGFSIGADVKPGERVTLIKYTAVLSSLYYDRQLLVDEAVSESKKAKAIGWDALVNEHKKVWEDIWNETDVIIDGDPEAQQGIRFNIFQLNQTYRGDDPRLNIGSKGFTGEKYGGNTYWNTELCCVPFFLLSNPKDVARNLLLYRYNHLPKAIENAKKLGFSGGAALYPMVTINGDECHNEWEITFEEIHRNSIIAYAIMLYTTMTGNKEYVAHYGLEVLIAISRFWSQRVSFSQPKQKYVILGVTGPNEYENNVDNNWYTNYSCIQCLNVTLEYLEMIALEYPDEYARIRRKTSFDKEETYRWKEIIDNMYMPEDKELGIFVQHDGYLDKELKTVQDIPTNERPINQHWSWDRILRSCYIKQSDVLLGLYLYYTNFDKEFIRRNFDFYEPRTVHESSLSPYLHSILASRVGYVDKAYNLFLHAIRLDLDDYNNELEQGLHITSMAGGWLAIVRGFAGMQVLEGLMSFSPTIPQKWNSYTFKINFRERTLQLCINKRNIEVRLIKGQSLKIKVYEKEYILEENNPAIISTIIKNQ
ncbi:family 65 glycosyl hydrolase domain-containing protein [Bacteroides graminisolvens]|jgi:Trehalose and maltose hydrolases (possible phosphorylases)|uniref:Maltose phosphorylase n=1 Tax=Bacteroides graminisolvens DSM 19988 = JCM 15093 TaxID=1121097 RepID=A0A069D3E1_9BACE|nr:family 65 glycosyl hydrolase domain-containing protein [Bacteroides graminisolvens]GAK37418.1 maltose phosphorylase [Bacteroides graminisolvens DSM 19988 = JCM 15093]